MPVKKFNSATTVQNIFFTPAFRQCNVRRRAGKNKNNMSNKKLYFQFSDGADVSNVVMQLDGCLEWIKGDDLERKDEEDLSEIEYTIKPILLTDEEFENLTEAEI